MTFFAESRKVAHIVTWGTATHGEPSAGVLCSMPFPARRTADDGIGVIGAPGTRPRRLPWCSYCVRRLNAMHADVAGDAR